MNLKDLFGERTKKLGSALGKFKYVFLVIFIGLILLIWPGQKTSTAVQSAVSEQKAVFDLEGMEKKIADALSEIDGAGRVTVVLTMKAGSRRMLAEETSSDDTSAVLVSRGSGYQETVTVQELSPQYQGALVVCEGAGDPAVKLKLVEAVSALTGLGSNKISICKGK